MFLRRIFLRFLIFVFILFQFEISYSQWTDGQSAAFVMGQSDFISGTGSASSSTFNRPSQPVIDPVSGKIFIADFGSNRVLRFASTAAYMDGAVAEAVFGQPDMNTAVMGISASRLSGPMGITLDDLGNLWIADNTNNRVVRVSNAATAPSGTSFDLVLGQTSFGGAAGGSSLNKLIRPYSLYYKNNVLWVSDMGNNRILKFDNPNLLSNGAIASSSLGSGTAGTTAEDLRSSAHLFVDDNGSLWVADRGNNRVLRFSNANTLIGGAPADLVIGQSGFTTSAFGVSSTALSSPGGVFVDAGGRLYIADGGNNRVLVYNDAFSMTSNNPVPSNVIGQTDFVTGTSGLAENKLRSPTGLFAGNDLLLVADFANNRVLVFDPSSPLPVHLLSFSATKEARNENVLLRWITIDETSFSRFEVEQSYDNIHFKAVADIKTKGGNNEYQIEVTTLNTDLGYFRLKMIDDDGSFSYSKVISINVNSELSVYPNPFSGCMSVVYPAVSGIVTIYNSLGKEVKSCVINNEVTLDLQSLPEGEYFVKIQSEEDILIRKVSKVD